MRSKFTLFKSHSDQFKHLQYAAKLHLSKESHMENVYTVYTKEINGSTFYFVKKYITFPEYRDVPDILESYGMHTDFNRACRIALVNDVVIKQQLLNTLPDNRNRPRVVHMNVAKIISTAVKNTQQAISKLKVAGHH
jgi:hypothetical protein